jgi:phospholipid/cholesterol/gamma-HCH transport system substrate-binding protein
MSKNVIETVVGLIVLAVAIGFIIIAYESGSIEVKKHNGFKISAQFDRIDGVNVGSDVKLSGIKIGKVVALSIHPKNFNAIVEISLDNQQKLPVDSSAEIIGNGFLGDKYISIVPGSDESFLKDGDKIEFTQSSISIESLIGKFIFGYIDSKKQNNKHAPLHN